MASDAQIIANRINALKSTGPKTAAGRAKSRMNALKYGLTAKQLIIFDEKEKDLSDLITDLFEDYQPVGAREEELTRQLARISQTGRCIGARTLRKLLCSNDLLESKETPRCRQSVARICLGLQR